MEPGGQPGGTARALFCVLRPGRDRGLAAQHLGVGRKGWILVDSGFTVPLLLSLSLLLLLLLLLLAQPPGSILSSVNRSPGN